MPASTLICVCCTGISGSETVLGYLLEHSLVQVDYELFRDKWSRFKGIHFV